MEHETEHLRLSDRTVYLVMGGPPDYDDVDDVRLGVVGECDDAVPDEYWSEYEQILDFYQDSVRFAEDCYAEADHFYLSSRGV